MSLFGPDGALGRVEHVDRTFTWTEGDDAPVLEESVPRVSLFPFVALVLVLVGVLGYRLISLQVTHGASNQLLAEGNRIRNRELLPPRGVIVDRYGEELATNTPEFVLELTPADLPRAKADREAAYARIAELVNLSSADIVARVETNGLLSLEPIALKAGLSHEESLLYKVQVRDLPSVRVVDRARRRYPEGAGFSHVLGYTGKVNEAELRENDTYAPSSMVGRTGIEQQYEAVLYGTPGVEQFEVDSRGYLQRVIGVQPPMPGETLKLTIDAALQRKLAEVLAAKLTELGSTAGAAVIERPSTGEVLALVSLPDFPANEFTAPMSRERYEELLRDERSLFTNRVIGGTYPSGSVVKPIVAAGALNDDVITRSTTIQAPGEIRIGDFVFPDWKVHGLTDVKKAIAVSSNVFFYAIGGGWEHIRGLGAERLIHYLQLFGFGERTGIDLPGEVRGLVPTPKWKQEVKKEPWYLGDTYHLSIGQGDFLVTPLQIAQSIVTVANRGRAVTPTLVAGRATAELPPVDVKSEALDLVREGMREGVLTGSSRRLQSLPVTSAGKTGTAQFGAEGKTHAWWTGFAPYESPEVVMTVLLEGSGAGNEIAVPVAEEVLQWYFSRPAELRQ
ncbi:MAG: penicillin-binding protein 2 [Patescibacteria group bacterium]|jgi:penicillin-binding protein 2